MNEITVFENEKFGSIRTTEINGEVWFVGKDVALALGYTNPSKAILDHINEDDKLNNESLSSLGQRGGWLINESGVYSLIFGSKLEAAKEFKHWVTSEVLPALRKTGSYTVTVPQKSQQELDNETKKLNLAEAEYWRSMGIEYSDNKTYKQILDAYSTKAVAGEFVLPLPLLETKNYSATEVGKMLGISANKVGGIANKLGIKTDGEYGKWYVDKSPYSSKEVNTFRYSDAAVDRIRKELR